MPGLDERLHELVAAAGQAGAVPPGAGVRRRGTRRRVVRSGIGGLAVVLLGVGCLIGFRAAQGPDRADVQPMTSDLPGGVQIEIVPSDDNDQDLKLVDADGRLSLAAFEDQGENDLWSFPQPDPARKLYLIRMVSPGTTGGCLSTRMDGQGFYALVPCAAEDATQLWQIEPDQDTVTFKGLGIAIGETDSDLLTLLVEPAGGPEDTGTPSPSDS